jgi:hypothetical protein
MKKIAEKFDELPQDFDREAIWKGIEKPKPVWISTSLGKVVSFLALGSVAALVVLSLSNQADYQKAVTPSILATAVSQLPTIPHDQPKTATTATENVPLPDSPQARLYSSSEPVAAHEMSSAITLDSPQASTNAREGASQEGNLLADERDPIPTGTSPAKGLLPNHLEALPVTFHLLETQPNLPAIEAQTSTSSPDTLRQSLAIRTGIGWHRSHFSTTNEEVLPWRNTLEAPQLDYSFGLRYEWQLKHQFLVSLTASYHLFKDEIRTTTTLDSISQEWDLEYKLHNHYHLFTSQLEFGKRFDQGVFFFDIQAGIGAKFLQIAEVDYFVEEGVLDSQVVIDRNYQNAANLFFTGQAALGKSLTEQSFLRIGAQFYSGITLTQPQADFSHRIVPIQLFCEVGMRF